MSIIFTELLRLGCRVPENTVKVRWRIRLHEYVGSGLHALLNEELLPLGPPDEVRIIYWFD